MRSTEYTADQPIQHELPPFGSTECYKWCIEEKSSFPDDFGTLIPLFDPKSPSETYYEALNRDALYFPEEEWQRLQTAAVSYWRNHYNLGQDHNIFDENDVDWDQIGLGRLRPFNEEHGDDSDPYLYEVLYTLLSNDAEFYTNNQYRAAELRKILAENDLTGSPEALACLVAFSLPLLYILEKESTKVLRSGGEHQPHPRILEIAKDARELWLKITYLQLGNISSRLSDSIYCILQPDNFLNERERLMAMTLPIREIGRINSSPQEGREVSVPQIKQAVLLGLYKPLKHLFSGQATPSSEQDLTKQTSSQEAFQLAGMRVKSLHSTASKRVEGDSYMGLVNTLHLRLSMKSIDIDNDIKRLGDRDQVGIRVMVDMDREAFGKVQNLNQILRRLKSHGLKVLSVTKTPSQNGVTPKAWESLNVLVSLNRDEPIKLSKNTAEKLGIREVDGRIIFEVQIVPKVSLVNRQRLTAGRKLEENMHTIRFKSGALVNLPNQPNGRITYFDIFMTHYLSYQPDVNSLRNHFITNRGELISLSTEYSTSDSVDIIWDSPAERPHYYVSELIKGAIDSSAVTAMTAKEFYLALYHHESSDHKELNVARDFIQTFVMGEIKTLFPVPFEKIPKNELRTYVDDLSNLLSRIHVAAAHHMKQDNERYRDKNRIRTDPMDIDQSVNQLLDLVFYYQISYENLEEIIKSALTKSIAKKQGRKR